MIYARFVFKKHPDGLCTIVCAKQTHTHTTGFHKPQLLQITQKLHFNCLTKNASICHLQFYVIEMHLATEACCFGKIVSIQTIVPD